MRLFLVLIFMEKLSEAMKLPRHSLITIYKALVRPHLDYGDILYDQPNNESICQKIGSIKYNAALVITCAIRDIFQMKFYNELGFESFKFRRWPRKLCLFYKIKKLVYLNICSI